MKKRVIDVSVVFESPAPSFGSFFLTEDIFSFFRAKLSVFLAGPVVRFLRRLAAAVSPVSREETTPMPVIKPRLLQMATESMPDRSPVLPSHMPYGLPDSALDRARSTAPSTHARQTSIVDKDMDDMTRGFLTTRVPGKK